MANTGTRDCKTLPRVLKRQLAIQSIYLNESSGRQREIRKMFIEAHKNFKAYKARKMRGGTGVEENDVRDKVETEE